MSKTIYTIGHSDLDIESFIKILKRHKIEVLIDIRSQPYSSYVKHFNKEFLKNILGKSQIDYYFGGNYLGGKPADESLYTNGKVDYELVRKSNDYKKGLSVLKKLAALKNVILMCSEENPEKCHRKTLLSQDLKNMGFEVRHIRMDGSYEVFDEQPKQFKLNDPSHADNLLSPLG